MGGRSHRELVRRAREIVRTGGPSSVAHKALDVLRLHRRLVVLDVPLAPARPRPYDGPGRVSVRRLQDTSDDLARYLHLRPDATMERLRARLDRGELCCVTLLDDAFVSSSWGARGGAYVQYLDCEVEVGRDAGYAYDSYTAPLHRGADLVSRCSDMVRSALAECGCRRLYGMQLPENTHANARWERRGYTVLGVARVVGIGPLRSVFVRPARSGALPESFVLRPSLRRRARRAGESVTCMS
ncbi:hypothetical protein K2Z84_33620 [Candidatus Binatia bacterium]|jgi:hypothetical protein|nr:hypothetical protein [Candidatus Binatia bacterium]